MKRINETMQVRMTMEEANLVNELLDRNEAMAVVADEKEPDRWCYCPVCGQLLNYEKKFCSQCGQRVDTQNTALV